MGIFICNIVNIVSVLHWEDGAVSAESYRRKNAKTSLIWTTLYSSLIYHLSQYLTYSVTVLSKEVSESWMLYQWGCHKFNKTPSNYVYVVLTTQPCFITGINQQRQSWTILRFLWFDSQPAGNEMSFPMLNVLSNMHNNVVIMSVITSQITSRTIVYSAVHSGAHQRKHESSALLAFVRGIHRWPGNSPHKGPVRRKMFPFDNVIMFYFIDDARHWHTFT